MVCASGTETDVFSPNSDAAFPADAICGARQRRQDTVTGAVRKKICRNVPKCLCSQLITGHAPNPNDAAVCIGAGFSIGIETGAVEQKCQIRLTTGEIVQDQIEYIMILC